MKKKIGKYDEDTRTVPVTFEVGDIVHRRSVNACLTADGLYDRKATCARVADVARGVAAKIDLGVIGNAPEPAPTTATDTADA